MDSHTFRDPLLEETCRYHSLRANGCSRRMTLLKRLFFMAFYDCLVSDDQAYQEFLWDLMDRIDDMIAWENCKWFHHYRMVGLLTSMAQDDVNFQH